jgi:ketosteroid isomerase-like protein
VENVEIVRRAFEAWYPNDAEGFARHLDPEFEYLVTYGPERGVHRGWRATVDAFNHWQDVFSDYRWEAAEYIDAGEAYVVVPFVEHGLGQRSGVTIAQRPAFLCTMRNRRILRLTEYQTTADALKAAGLGGYWDRDVALADLDLKGEAASQESTTPDLGEAMRRLENAFNERDLDAVMSFFNPNAVYEGSAWTYEGAVAIRGLLDDWFGLWDEFDLKVEEFSDIGNGVTLSIVLQSGRPVASTGHVQFRFASVAVWAETMIERLTNNAEIDEALAVAEQLAEGRQ